MKSIEVIPNSARSPEASVLDRDIRLSQSSLWKLQRQFFDEQGVQAWSEHRTPTQVTSNAMMAEAYAQVILSFVRDCTRRGAGESFCASLDEPLYIVELGAGTGYFAHLMVSKLKDLCADASYPIPRLVYVLTDFTDSNVEFWHAHPRFQQLAGEGLIDIARFDAESDSAMELRFSKRRLEPGNVVNPMVGIANYVFDAISHDVFQIHQGTLQDGLVTLSCDPPDPHSSRATVDRLGVDYRFSPVAGDAYGDPSLDTILAEYCAELDDTVIPFPVGGLGALGRLTELASGALLVLSADKGVTEMHELTSLTNAVITKHGGCVSMMVNYHAMGRLMSQRGGFIRATSERNAAIDVVALSTGSPQILPDTLLAFERAITRFGPLDILELTLAPMPQKWNAEQLLAWLRMSAWDPQTCLSLLPHLSSALMTTRDESYRRIRRAMDRVWELYLPLPGDIDLAFELGVLHYRMSCYPEAMTFFDHSLSRHEDNPQTIYNQGLCLYRLGRRREAVAWFERALELAPSYTPARGWRLRVLAELYNTNGERTSQSPLM